MERVYVDTNIFIGAFEAFDKTSAEIRSLFAAFEKKPNVLVTSDITLGEIDAYNSRSRELAYVILSNGLFIDFVPVSREIILETCDYRLQLRESGRNMKLPDAIHCVTAIRACCDFVFSADQRFWVPPHMERIGPDEAGFSKLRATLDA